MASRRWAQMIPVISRNYDVYVCTIDGAGDLEVPLDENKILRLGKLKNLAFEVSEYRRSNPLHKLISLLTENMRAVDSTILTWYWKNRKNILEYVDQIKPDIVVSTIGPGSSALIGKYIKRKRPDMFCVLDVRDILGPFDSNLKKWLHIKIDMLFEKYAIGKPDLITTVGKKYAQTLSKFYKLPVKIVYNGFQQKEITTGIKSKAGNKKVIYYAGKLYPYRYRSVELFFLALKESDVTINFRLVANKSEFDHISNFIKSNDIKNVSLLTPAKAEIVNKEQKQADILVLFEDLDEYSSVTAGTLSGKIFEYLCSGSPIMAVCRKDSELADLFQETKRGKIVSNKAEILEFIKNNDQFRLQNEKQIMKYSRENQAEIFCKLLEEHFYERTN